MAMLEVGMSFTFKRSFVITVRYEICVAIRQTKYFVSFKLREFFLSLSLFCTWYPVPITMLLPHLDYILYENTRRVNQIEKLEIAANPTDHDSPILLLHTFDKNYTQKQTKNKQKTKQKNKKNKARKQKQNTNNKRQKQNTNNKRQKQNTNNKRQKQNKTQKKRRRNSKMK